MNLEKELNQLNNYD